MIGALRKLARCRRGVTAIEYGLIVSFICVAVIATISLIGGKTLSMWTNVSAKMPVVQG